MDPIPKSLNLIKINKYNLNIKTIIMFKNISKILKIKNSHLIL